MIWIIVVAWIATTIVAYVLGRKHEKAVWNSVAIDNASLRERLRNLRERATEIRGDISKAREANNHLRDAIGRSETTVSQLRGTNKTALDIIQEVRERGYGNNPKAESGDSKKD